MADPKHVEILKQGVEVWNKWREENPDIEPNLCMTSLLGLNLSSANLSRLNLMQTNFEGAILREADFTGSNLGLANLSGADLLRANFREADLSSANMEGIFASSVDFCGANLSYTNLLRAHLYGSNLSRAKFIATNLEQTNLLNARYLPTAGNSKGVRLNGCHGNERFRRHIQHEAFINELKESGPLNKWLVKVWALFADCGRSPWRWLGWSAISVLLHANIYWWGLGETAFYISGDNSLSFEPWTALYYSIVTFTTLGFGDITPTAFWSMFWVTSEVIAGYVMLGGLISFIFSKLLPRG